MDIPKAESEKSLRGSREAFAEDLDTNMDLITKRIKDPQLKSKELILGRRTKTRARLLYMEGIAYEGIIKEAYRRLEHLCRDEVLDGGVAEQLTKGNIWSPFPQYQATERPDRVTQALLEGRIAVLFDHSPEALILPVTLNTLFQTSDDYYRHFWIVTFLRLVRYMAALLSVFLPGFFVAVTGYHTQILPTNLVLVMAASRVGVPFPCIVEVILMELSFELIREAGLRMPGAIGNTIGIVGGLIIGQSAVSANLVSPMTVVIVALTALGSFSIPNEELSEALRLIKYLILLLCGFFGIFGLVFGGYLLVVHLAGLKSFGIPYLYPFAAAEMNDGRDIYDSLFRAPMKALWKRPIYAKREQRVRMRDRKEEKDVRQ